MTLGIVPLIFERLGANNNEDELIRESQVKKEKDIFKFSMFANEKENENSKENLAITQAQKKLFRSSIIVNKVNPKAKDENLEFLISTTPNENQK